MPVSETLREKYHRAARFWPAHRDDPDGQLSWPALEVAGAIVFVYVDGNTLRVSVDLDTPHRGIVERPGTRSTVPLHITVQGTTVFYEPSERSQHIAWSVLVPDGERLLFDDDEARLARRTATARGGRLQVRTAGERIWNDAAPHLPGPVALAAAAETVWVLRRWDRHDDVVTLHSTEDSALADLAEYVEQSWSNVATEDDVPDQPPSVAREAIQLYYGPDRDCPDEGYCLYEEEVTGRAGTRIVQLDSAARPSVAPDACQRCGGIGFLARAIEWVSAPALCADCHETLGTRRVRDGRQCLDGCPQSVGHTGLCLP